MVKGVFIFNKRPYTIHYSYVQVKDTSSLLWEQSTLKNGTLLTYPLKYVLTFDLIESTDKSIIQNFDLFIKDSIVFCDGVSEFTIENVIYPTIITSHDFPNSSMIISYVYDSHTDSFVPGDFKF